MYSDIYLLSIHKYILIVWKKHRNILYELDVPVRKRTKDDVAKNSKKNFDQPFFELFIWGVLTQKMELLDYFWERSGCPVLAAMFAASFYQVQLSTNFCEVSQCLKKHSVLIKILNCESTSRRFHRELQNFAKVR